jgi:adenosine deaminase
MRLTLPIITRLPKTDIHCHLDGCLRPRTMLELAEAQGVRLPTHKLGELTRLLTAGKRTRSLGDYLRIFDLTLSVMQEREALYRVAYELAEDAAAENVRHLEVRYSPILHRKRRLSWPDIIEPVIAGLADAGRKHSMTTGTIICGIRSMAPKTSLLLAELAVAYKGRGVLAFDLAGQEKDYPAKAHRAAFQLILKNNINSTVHAGEAFGPASIGQALHYCGAHRIGHGTRLREDPEILRYVNDHRIPLEMCPTSNVQTGASPSLRAHPFRAYLKLGLRVTLNTDNRLVSSTTMTQELDRVVTALRLRPSDVRHVLLNGFKSAFLPFREKGELLLQAVEEIDGVFRTAHAGAVPEWDLL